MNKTATPRVSVNLAVYNTAKYVSAAINSILSQSFSDFELIIIDDGSTDGSWKILQDFSRQDHRVRLFQQENKGVAKARNLALHQSRGDYIAVMDSDDISLPQRLESQKSFLDKHSEIDAVGSQWLMINTDGEDLGIDTHATNPEDVETLMFAYYSLHHPTTMIRRKSMLAAGGYNEDKDRLCVDYHLFMKMQLSGCKLTNLPYVLFKWRLNPKGITQSKASRQTKYVSETRDDGFKQLLQKNQNKAHSIAQSIVYTFPTGTWQDSKIQQLLPKAEDSLLYKTWLSLPVTTAEEYLFRTLILWLRAPAQHYSDLSTQLEENKLPWLASLVIAQQNKGKVISPPLLGLSNDSSKTCNYLLTLFIPFVKDDADFTQRLQQAQELQENSDLSIEVLIFSANTTELPSSIFAGDKFQSDWMILPSPLAWELALKNARGQYFIYLEANFRFQVDRLFSQILKTVKADDDLVYLVDKRYYTAAVDKSGKPQLDNAPSPNWNRSTLLGKNRLALSGFIHKRKLFEGVAVKLDECGVQTSRILASHLAKHNNFSIQGGAIDYFIPAIDLNSTPLATFQKTILDWYFDFGMSQLPASNTWSQLSTTETYKLALALSEAWQKENLILFRGNTYTIKLYYLDKVNHPLQYPLFRHLLLHDKKNMLTSLWHKKKAILLFSAALYCFFTILRNRLTRLFIK